MIVTKEQVAALRLLRKGPAVLECREQTRDLIACRWVRPTYNSDEPREVMLTDKGLAIVKWGDDGTKPAPGVL